MENPMSRYIRVFYTKNLLKKRAPDHTLSVLKVWSRTIFFSRPDDNNSDN